MDALTFTNKSPMTGDSMGFSLVGGVVLNLTHGNDIACGYSANKREESSVTNTPKEH